MSGRNPNKDVHSKKNGGALIICCKKGLISKHSKYFETFCRNIVKLELISDFICIFASSIRMLSGRWAWMTIH